MVFYYLLSTLLFIVNFKYFRAPPLLGNVQEGKQCTTTLWGIAIGAYYNFFALNRVENALAKLINFGAHILMWHTVHDASIHILLHRREQENFVHYIEFSSALVN